MPMAPIPPRLRQRAGDGAPPRHRRCPGPAEDDGWVLFLIWNGARCASDLVILDAASMAEVAVLELPLAIPYGLHGSFAKGRKAVATLLHCPKQQRPPWP